MEGNTMAMEHSGTPRTLGEAITQQAQSLDPLAELLQKAVLGALEGAGPPGQSVKSFLHGIWLGHSLHPALSDVPIGAWSFGVIMDVLGEERAADLLLGMGVASAIPTAASGMADWAETGRPQRSLGLLHALFNTLGLGCFVGSLLARGAGNRALGVGLSTTGLMLGLSGAYVGGELVFSKGTGVDRNAWNPAVSGYEVAARAADLQDGKLAAGQVTVDGETLPLVLLKQGTEILALGAVCSHWGCSLAEGKLVDEEIVECPCHGSRFSLRDGSVKQGPAAYPQPRFQARLRAGNVEVRQLP
jgi:nitrite reductase/ring-hydroxylating ferredoxin subunit